MSEQCATDLERRLATELHREMERYVTPFDADAVAQRAMGGRSTPLRGPLLVAGTILVAAILTVVGVTVLPPAGSRTGSNLAIKAALTVHLGTGGEVRGLAVRQRHDLRATPRLDHGQQRGGAAAHRPLRCLHG